MSTPTNTHSSSGDGYEVVKWYTRARRFPQLIGKTPDGATIWGGPYTYTQVIAGVAFIVIGSKTTWLWGHFGLLGNALILVGGHQTGQARDVQRIRIGRIAAVGHRLQHGHALQHGGHFLQHRGRAQAVQAQVFDRLHHRLAVAMGQCLDQAQHITTVDTALTAAAASRGALVA